MFSTLTKPELYRVATEGSLDLSIRYEACRRIKKHRLYNPYLGEVNTFIQKHQGLVYVIAKRLFFRNNKKVSLDDLIQVGNEGLLKAYCRFNPNKGRFEHLAGTMIQNEIRRCIRDQGSMIRPAKRVYELAGKIMKQRLQDKSLPDICKALGCSEAAAKRALDQIDRTEPVSLNSQISSDTEEDIISLIRCEDDLTGIFVGDFLSKLTPLQRDVIESYINGDSQQVIADRIGCSQMQVSRIYRKVADKAAIYFGIEVSR